MACAVVDADTLVAAASTVGLAAFVVRCRRVSHPLIDLRVFASRTPVGSVSAPS